MIRWAAALGALILPPAHAGTPSPERQAELENLLRQDCGSCHGMTLKGGLGPALLPDKLAEKPDAWLLDTILNGRPGTAMPPWRGFFSVDEATWLVRRLRNPP